MSSTQSLIKPPVTSEAPYSDVAGAATRIDPDITHRHPTKVPEDAPAHVPCHHKRTLPIFSLEGKTCVVTGGARGLGYVMAQAFVESGADLAIVDLNGDEAAKSAKTILDTFVSTNPDSPKPTITSHTCDVSNPESVATTFQDITSKHKNGVDVLVTSAGFTENFKAEEYPHNRMQKLWGVNVDGTYLCSTEVAKEWIKSGKKGGSIIMVGSMSGVAVNVPQPQAPYNASKAAVRQLAASFAIEWAPHGIRVNCISPGYMMTALTKKIIDEQPDLYNNWVSRIPAGRMGNPVDLMGAVVYLASDASSYTTGADIRIDGGYTVI
ncbi:hypothetical protein H072_6500 [Dactylellina haptotyla CBS 200.50]|uniref:Uncharacterized protein n=1 Tax=Dactylellina haptotyla (strain CBS 200.50) TaxID=1284197 RepID=S8A9V7_DACHA|nr:hypothetical protein H072_6500 [Dactylellina haptotyla CBS 200.50]